MNIIHLCPSTDFELMQYVSMMFASDEEPFITNNVDVFISRCKKSRPDIVHLHGCDSAELVKLTSKSQRQGIRTIITTHGRLDATSSVAHTHMAKEVLAHAYALVARSTMEADELKAMGVNKRIEIVSNPLVTRTTSEENLRASYKRIYQCVMESNPLELMNDATKEALHKLLKVGITEDERWATPISNADNVDWHLLKIYSIYEGVFHYVEKGIHSMRFSLKDAAEKALNEIADVTNALSLNTPRGYLPDDYEKPLSLSGQSVIDIVASIRELSEEQHLSLLPLVELDIALRRNDVDDEYLMQQLAAAKLNDFFASLLTILTEQTAFDEGFMPCEPSEDATTRRLRSQIEEHLKI